MGKYKIIKEFWIDIGHRMYKHDLLKDRGSSILKKKNVNLGWKRNKDIHPHGHTLVIQLVMESDNLDPQGMSIDTDKIKLIINEFKDIYDHAFILSKDDPVKDKFIELFPDCRIIIMDKIPTAEALAEEVFKFFDKRLKELCPEEYPRAFKISQVIIKTAHTASSIYEP